MKQIAYITDAHLDDNFPIEAGVNPRKNLETILADVRDRNIRNIIIGGDIGEPVSHSWFFGLVNGFTMDITLGNHDSFHEIIQYYPKQSQGIDELYYAYEDGGFKYIFLDSSSNRISDAQFQWLRHELETQKKILLFIHHPILKVDTPVDRAYPLRNRDHIRGALQNISNNITVFAGHYHVDDECNRDNIKQFVTPAASVQLVKNAPAIKTDNSFFGYRVLTIYEDNIDAELVLF